ncbi:unnamed protein product [Anisakis simplex]|uniref:CoRest (inferred by orthology to a D. melanogaster protein) n=1 Tax=Anisakis simplex TaxID=6269 RepID=A0A0M3K7Q9_ANISI|nr:unnamed protein product [Anisakis simplex]
MECDAQIDRSVVDTIGEEESCEKHEENGTTDPSTSAEINREKMQDLKEDRSNVSLADALLFGCSERSEPLNLDQDINFLDDSDDDENKKQADTDDSCVNDWKLVKDDKKKTDELIGTTNDIGDKDKGLYQQSDFKGLLDNEMNWDEDEKLGVSSIVNEIDLLNDGIGRNEVNSNEIDKANVVMDDYHLDNDDMMDMLMNKDIDANEGDDGLTREDIDGIDDDSRCVSDKEQSSSRMQINEEEILGSSNDAEEIRMDKTNRNNAWMNCGQEDSNGDVVIVDEDEDSIIESEDIIVERLMKRIVKTIDVAFLLYDSADHYIDGEKLISIYKDTQMDGDSKRRNDSQVQEYNENSIQLLDCNENSRSDSIIVRRLRESDEDSPDDSSNSNQVHVTYSPHKFDTVTNATANHCNAFRLPTNLEIREGDDYQCIVGEDFDEREMEEENDNETREYCLWLPTEQLSDEDITDYLSVALGVYNIEQDRALYILHECGYNLEEAYEQLTKRRIVRKEWNDDDINAFLRALKLYGKRFSKIKKLMPNKSVSEIVNFYYDMKKKLRLRSILDQRAEEGYDNYSSDGSESDGNADENTTEGPCGSCGRLHTGLRKCADMNLCPDCYDNGRKYHSGRRFTTCCASDRRRNKQLKCPLKMVDLVGSFGDFYQEYYVNAIKEFRGDMKDTKNLKESRDISGSGDDHGTNNEDNGNKSNGNDNTHENNSDSKDDEDDDVLIIEDNSAERRAAFIRKCEKMMKDMQVLYLRERSLCVRMEHEDSLESNHFLSDGIEKYRKMVDEWTASKVEENCASANLEWTEKETFRALFGFRRFGKDFEAIASLLESKSVDMIEEFYEKHKAQADQMIEKFDDEVQKNLNEIDFEQIFDVPQPDAELIELE